MPATGTIHVTVTVKSICSILGSVTPVACLAWCRLHVCFLLLRACPPCLCASACCTACRPAHCEVTSALHVHASFRPLSAAFTESHKLCRQRSFSRPSPPNAPRVRRKLRTHPLATPITTPEGTLSVCFEPFEVGFVDRPLSFLLPPFVPAVRTAGTNSFAA
jgi:hypothetical protein